MVKHDALSNADHSHLLGWTYGSLSSLEKRHQSVQDLELELQGWLQVGRDRLDVF